MSKPTLLTQRIRLEPLTDAHADVLVELDSDPEVLRHIFGRALSREEVLRDRMPHRTRVDADRRGLGYWVGYADEEWLGWWCLAVDDADERAAELGYRLRRTAWGCGYATEGARALLDHAFGTVGLTRIWAETRTANTGSRRVLEKLGLTEERTDARSCDPLPEWERSEVVYAVTHSPT